MEFNHPIIKRVKDITLQMAATVDYKGSRYELVIVVADGNLSVSITNLYMAISVPSVKKVAYYLCEKGMSEKDASNVESCVEALLESSRDSK